ncbi:unnamed protein product, partial [Schistosoma mattheei]
NFRPSEDEVRILLIADSHIEGYHSNLWIFNEILQADSDNYLRFYFIKAVQRTNPNGVMFLGDLLDTGDISLNSDFIHVILTPGDNDIGGEGNLITQKTLTRFFANLPVNYGDYKYKFVNFYSVTIIISHNFFSRIIGSLKSDLKYLMKILMKLMYISVIFQLSLRNMSSSLRIYLNRIRSTKFI